MKNKKAPARHKAEDDYLLTTKLYCGKCGSFMVGESGTSHTMKVHRPPSKGWTSWRNPRASLKSAF